MNMKPMLFNTEMVRAILDGRKTVTRRVVDIDTSNQFDVETDRKTVIAYIDQKTGDSYAPTKICRYQPGDILYVRETWCDDRQFTHDDTPGRYFYKASENEDFTVKWKPSIHMPKEAARIFLKVTNVRVERLQNMNWNDICNEGIISDSNVRDNFSFRMLQNKFTNLWNATIKKSDLDRYGWNANPWVFVIEFEKINQQDIENVF